MKKKLTLVKTITKEQLLQITGNGGTTTCGGTKPKPCTRD